MKKTRESSARKVRRAVKFTYPARPVPTSRRSRWIKVGLAMGILVLVGYLGYAGHLGTAGDWRRHVITPIRNWLWPPPAPEVEDPEEAAEPAINDRKPPGPAPQGMVWVPGGWFWRGSDLEICPDAAPMRKIYVDGFWMDAKTITNRQFKAFVDETGYQTVAERKPDLKEFSRLSPEAMGFQPHYLHALAANPAGGFPGAVAWGGLFHCWPALDTGSLVFTPPDHPVDLHDHSAWWQYVPGACWRHPHGPDKGDLKGLEDHPAVHICWHDAMAYCQWRSKKEGKKFRLPTEAEWEFAARGGLDRKVFAWGDEQTPGGKWMCNIWQGEFPRKNDKLDGYEGTSPVGSYPPNGYGLYDMAGNVWQWCADWYRPEYYKDCPKKNPPGPLESFDPNEPGQPKRVQRGGSFLCCDNYCVRYVVVARGKGEPKSAANHIGFRSVAEP
jgi:formylglycine-generating enzyme required for sulfatase activity